MTRVHVAIPKKQLLTLRCPGIEPGSTAWKAAMLTTIPTSLRLLQLLALGLFDFLPHVTFRTRARLRLTLAVRLLLKSDS